MSRSFRDPKIAFIYFSQANDGGWSEAHERGRQKTAEALGMEIPYVENVEETTEAVRQVVDLYIGRGFNIIIGTSYGFGDQTLGTMGIFGPSRMDYAAVIPLVNYLGDRLSQALERTMA